MAEGNPKWNGIEWNEGYDQWAPKQEGASDVMIRAITRAMPASSGGSRSSGSTRVSRSSSSTSTGPDSITVVGKSGDAKTSGGAPWPSNSGVQQYHFFGLAPEGIDQLTFSEIMSGRMRGTDSATCLSVKSTPVIEGWVAEVARLAKETAPAGLLDNYVLGVLQVTHMKAGSSLQAHVDPASYGDVIVTFTTQDIDVTLRPKPKSLASGSKASVTKRVHAGHFYMISEQCRTYASHEIREMSDPGGYRVGVTLRYYPVAIIELLRREMLKGATPSSGTLAMEAKVGARGWARWPAELGGVKAYPSVYEVEVKKVCSSDEVEVMFVPSCHSLCEGDCWGPCRISLSETIPLGQEWAALKAGGGGGVSGKDEDEDEGKEDEDDGGGKAASKRRRRRR